ncbi:glucose-6-phosphate isomerase [Nocardioides salsibiostraticola]
MTSSYRVELRHGDGYDAILQELNDDRVASRIAAQDPTLWGPEAEEEAGKRLSWVQSPAASRDLVSDIETLRAEFAEKGLTHVVLCGMGGSSLGPEVICAGLGMELTVVDSSQPDFVRGALEDRLDAAVVVVSSKSGGTVETDSQRRAFEKAFTDAGIDPAERIVVVTDPGSPLESSAREAGYRVFLSDPEVGGRFSALTAFGLVPSGLAGVDIAQILLDAEAMRSEVEEDSTDNPALRLGALMGAAHRAGVDKLVIAPHENAQFFSFGDWVEQLVAESTGKDGLGILPVVVPSTEDPNVAAGSPDSVQVVFGADPSASKPPETAPSGWSAVLGGDLGGQILLWEYATAIAGRVMGINPFDQPDVESAKSAARDMLDGGGTSPEALFTDGSFTVYANDGWLPAGTDSVDAAISALLDQTDAGHGYVSVQAYLDRHRHTDLIDVRDSLAERVERPVTFGWGPRFLHSTGQYHKGGPTTGVYVQITAAPVADLAVPDRPFTFDEFLTAQAVGDGRVLADRGRPVLRLHLSSIDEIHQVFELLS